MPREISSISSNRAFEIISPDAQAIEKRYATRRNTMLLSTQTFVLSNRLGFEQAVNTILDAGFDAIDLSFFSARRSDGSLHTMPDYRSLCERLRRIAEERGAVFNQAHAPCGSPWARYSTECVPEFPRVFECCSILGVKTLVVHPVQDGRFYGHEREMLERSIEFYRGLIPMAKEHGVKIGVENMWTTDARDYIVDDTLASPEQFRECVDRLDSEWIVACLDIGHVALCGREPADLIRALGHERLHALHVHDVDLIHDSHTIPFGGKLNWDSITSALREIRYDGDFTFEADYYLAPYPTELLPSALRHLAETGRYLMNKIIG